MNRWKHRIPGGILAVLLAAVFALPAYPKAGDEVVKIDFDDGTVCGFETYTEGGAFRLTGTVSLWNRTANTATALTFPAALTGRWSTGFS